MSRDLSDGMTIIDVKIHAPIKILSDSMSLADSYTRKMVKTIVDSINLSDENVERLTNLKIGYAYATSKAANIRNVSRSITTARVTNNK